MALCGEMDHGVDGFFRKQPVYEGCIGDVAMDEPVAVTMSGLDVRQAGKVAGIGQGIEGDDPQVVVATEQMAHEVRADEPGPAGDEGDPGVVVGGG